MQTKKMLIGPTLKYTNMVSENLCKNFFFIYRKSSIKPPRGLIFFKHFWGDLKEKGGLFVVKRINGSKVPLGLTCGSWAAFSNDTKIGTILHRELEHTVEKVKHMKSEVVRLKTKNNINFQPDYTITDHAVHGNCL